MSMFEIHPVAAPSPTAPPAFRAMRRSLGKAVFAKTLLLITGVSFAGFAGAQSDAPNDPIKTLVGRLDLARYKATIKALTKFGDRHEGSHHA